jgi:hypothetical protein
MKRRSRSGGRPVEPRRHKKPTPKRRKARGVARRSSSAADLETEVARLTRELALTRSPNRRAASRPSQTTVVFPS